MFQGAKCPGGCTASQETQSADTKLFNKLKCSECVMRFDSKYSYFGPETVNLMKSKKKDKAKGKESVHTSCECNDASQQTNERSKNAKDKDDTFSFTSCSLKKLLTADSPRLMMILIVAVGALAVMLVLKCICCPSIISDPVQEIRARRSDDQIREFRRPWEASKSRLMSEFSDLTGKDTRESNLHSGDVDYPEYMMPELSSILDPIKVNEGYGSNNLREFYRKLLKTDIQIKNLKKGFTNIKRGNSIDLSDPNSPRLKRSLNFFTDTSGMRVGFPTLNKHLEILNNYYPNDAWKTDDAKKSVEDDLSVGFPGSKLEQSVEKQKLLMKAEKFENEHTQKEVLNSQQPVDATSNEMENPHVKHFELIDALFGRESSSTQHRRLLQLDDDEDENDGDDESADYEDQTKEPWEREKRTVKASYEELTTEAWDTATSEPIVSSYEDNLWDREGRTVKPTKLKTEKQTESIPAVILPKTKSPNKKDPSSIDNEINFLIEAAMRMATGKINIMEKYPHAMLTNSKTEYFEDNGNYDELVKMAQAYSDYGVLDSKKEIVEKNAPLGNTIKVIASEKQHDVLGQLNNDIDNSLRGQRIKLKSNSETKAERGNYLKRLRLKLFSKDNNLEPTTPSSKQLTSKDVNATGDEVITTWSIFSQKKAQKHKERNIMFSGHRRSLKSIETEEPNVVKTDFEAYVNNTVKLSNDEDSTTINVKIYTNTMDAGSKYEQNKTNMSKETYDRTNISVDLEEITPILSESTLNNNSNTSWSLGDVFGVIADFCMFLSGFDENQDKSDYRFLFDFVTMLNPNFKQPESNTTPARSINNTRTPIEASIDSEMVDNIGHRSRVLMSFEDQAENATEANSDKEDRSESYVIKTNKEHANTSIENEIANSSKIEKKNAETETNNRTVVKRSANGNIGNVIFWNDLYDDEYGVKDPLEDDMKDKSSVKYNERVRKDNWIGAKFKMLAKSLKERRNRKMERKKNSILKKTRNKGKNHTKRAVPVSDDSSKHMFEGLTVKMKRVCHEAAKAIHETTNREVRADSNQASTLMQQLVSLMSELVDLQVREKTCIQLPEDLRSFLAWLTSPNTKERDDLGFTVDSYDASPTSNLHNPETYELMSSNARSECLGTIQDVEELIMQYDEMSEEDKSKMSGVREYLEHQLHYLHKQLSSFNEYGSSIMYQDQSIRKRRQPNPMKKHRKRKPYRFLSYGRKHTKYTISDDYFTEDYKSFKVKDKSNEYYMSENKHENREDIRKFDSDNVNEGSRKSEGLKRMKDDYYSALVRNNQSVVS